MGLKPGADGKRVSLKYLVPPYGEMWQRVAEYVRQSLGKVGIDIVLEGIDVGGWAARCGNWEFEISAPWTYQYGDPALGVSRSYISSNIRKGILFSNTSGYSNPEVDRLFEAAAVAPDDATRQKLYSQVQKILVEDAAVAWLMELDFPTFTDKHIKDLVVTGSGVNDTFARAYRA
jgi:peptide/nickel transport system substrate-binding protein